ncbi:MAG: EVE domain-containing protein [Microgenomates group bacterium]
MQDEQKYWVVTASADHAENGRNWGIVQACHGKVTPLRRMQVGDGVVIYSSKISFKGNDPLMAFTAIGRVSGDEPYQFDMGGGFVPWQRGVQWQPHATALPIRPLLEQLDLTRGLVGWGMVFRYGLTQMTRADFALLARAMVPVAQAIPFSSPAPHIG